MSGFTIGIGIRRPSIIPSGYSNIFPDTTNNLLLEAAADANTEAIGDVSEILERINNETL